MMDINRIFKLAFGHVVSKSREAACLTVVEVAERSNVTINRLQQIERGAVDANVIEIIRIAMALRIRPAELVLRAEVMAEILSGDDKS